MTKNIDPILVSVIQNRFKSLTTDMGTTVLRTARSPLLHESRDFATGLFDGKGRMLEQANYALILAGGLQPALKYIIDYYEDEIFPGDVIFHSDVFTGCNQHADVTAWKPVFYGDKLVAWAGCKGHQADIGGPVPGGYNNKAKDFWEEALRITPVKVYERGKLRKDVWDLIFANIRYPVVAEDMRAQIGGCVIGERGILELIDRYGLDTFESHVEALFDSTEKMTRSEIRAMPDGTYTAETYMNYDGVNEGSRYKIKVTITIAGDEITFDYTGTDPQAPTNVNAPHSASLSGVLLSFMMLVSPDLPRNDGMTRPIHVHFPEGTIVNAKFPAATMYGNHLAEQHGDVIFAALSEAVPDRVTAGWNRMVAGITIGWDPRRNRPYHDILFIAFKGGSGAMNGVNGYDHIGPIYGGGGCLATDYEMFELTDPHLLLKHEYLQDSAGPGQWKGGLGVETRFKFYGENTMLVTLGDADMEGAFGLMGGKKGSPNKIELVYPDGKSHIPKTKDIVPFVPPGTIYIQQAGGGGGYGDPYLRPIEKVREDVRNGFISVEKAKDDYGVVIDLKTFEVNYKATEKIRKKWGESKC